MLKIAFLGPLHVTWEEKEVNTFVSEKARALLCYLAASKQSHSRTSLAGLLWRDDPEEKAKNSLRVVLANLRKLLPGAIEATRISVRFAAENPHWLDIELFESESTAMDPQQPDFERLQSLGSLIRGEFLEDLQTTDMPTVYEWLLSQRAYWNEKSLRVLLQLAQEQQARQAYPQSAETARRLLQLEPWNEEGHRLLMRAQSQQGEFNAALAQYETLRALLQEELNVEPMAETMALVERIQAARAGRPTNLPTPSTAFIGRQQEVVRIMEMLLNPDCRLVTIVGIGGIGKTSLALAAAHEIAQSAGLLFLDGITYVSLQAVEAATSDSDAIATAVAEALKLHLPGRHSPSAEVADYLEPEDHLLIFDNFEHLQGGTSWLALLLRRCPHLKMLVTSRELLNLAAEWRFDLLGLPYPAKTRRAPALNRPAQEFEAVQLFVQAAQQARPGFTLTAENTPYVVDCCQLVMGMPLAIKLAASWLRIMPTERLTKELRHNLDLLSTRMYDVPARQRSMRAVFDSTWDMLETDEQHVLAALSVFRGGFTADAAEELAQAAPFDLAELQDRGLLQYDAADSRYFLHELVRQFAAEKLTLYGDQLADTHEAHSRYYAAYLRRQIVLLLSDRLPEAMLDMDKEIANIRAGLRWAMRSESEDVLPDLGSYARALRFYYLRRGLYHEGMENFRLLIQRFDSGPADGASPAMEALLGPVTFFQGIFYYVLGDLSTAAQHFQRSLNLLAKRDPDLPFVRKDMAGAHHMSGQVEENIGSYEAARQSFQEAEKLDISLGDIGYAAKSEACIGVTHLNMGAAAEAQERLSAAIQKLRNNRDYFYSAIAMGNLALARVQLKLPFAEIDAQLRENLNGSRDLKSPLAEATTQLYLGVVLYLQGEFNEARERISKSVRIFEQINAPISISTANNWLAAVLLACGQRARAGQRYLACLKMSYEHGLLPLVIDSLVGLVRVAQLSTIAKLDLDQITGILALAGQHPATSARTRQEVQELIVELGNVDTAVSPPDFEQLVGQILRTYRP
ncbi:MAG: BTAD domain-containing putative transcriptional regulator [Candidatus Promineifilaceae bacterium]|nr:BTAD domain-containing putative transcriptional regulator [Candidatus Promineifilaceae bacterium]